MDPSRLEATHVAVREGRILGVGALAELKAWGAYSLDERFADKVLMPGFVEGHAMRWRAVSGVKPTVVILTGWTQREKSGRD